MNIGISHVICYEQNAICQSSVEKYLVLVPTQKSFSNSKSITLLIISSPCSCTWQLYLQQTNLAADSHHHQSTSYKCNLQTQLRSSHGSQELNFTHCHIIIAITQAPKCNTYINDLFLWQLSWCSAKLSVGSVIYFETPTNTCIYAYTHSTEH